MSLKQTRSLFRPVTASERLLPWLALVLLSVAAACGGPQAPQAPEEPLTQESAPTGAGEPAPTGPAGAVEGRLTFAGERPGSSEVGVTKDTEVCGKHPILKEELLVGPEGGLLNAVVSLHGVPTGGAATLPSVELRQRGCVFVPHVALVAAGRPLPVFNDDGILHNIHTFSTLNRPINKAQPKFLKRIEIQFDKPEAIRVACDAHPWMASWIIVSDHPYLAVSDANGRFRIEGVPAGTYTARVWHETLGERTQRVEVLPEQTADLAVELSRGS